MSERAKFHLYRQYRSVGNLRVAIENDPAVRADAEHELAAVDGIDRTRSVIAHEYATFLREALSDAASPR